MASPNDLQFQEFEEAAELLSADPGASTLSMSASNSASTTAGGQDVKLDLSEDEEGQEESSELLGGQKATGGFWTFEYYQSFFNVDTVQVLDRVKGSMMPIPGRNFIKHHIKSNPDLYARYIIKLFNTDLVRIRQTTGLFIILNHGPFWICVTLVFSVAISGNLSTFLSRLGDPSYHYRPQFHRVTIAALVIFLYAWLVPIALWGFLTWRQGAERQIGGYSFLETVCVYGYSLFIYIPTSVLWIIPFEWLRWTLILVAIVISGSVLVLTFWPVVRDDTKVMAASTVATIVVLHTLLAIGCKMYFFQTAEYVQTTTPTTNTSNDITVTTPYH